MHPTYLDHLTALHDNHGRLSRRPDERPRTGRLDIGLHYEIPGPGVLAERFALPWLAERGWDLYQHQGTLLARRSGTDEPPSPLPIPGLADDLRQALLALPERPGAGRQYTDLRHFAAEAYPATLDAYLHDVALAVRRRAPRWRPSKAPRLTSTRPAKSARERQADHRRRAATQEESTARWWLHNYLTGWDGDEPAPEPGTRIRTSDLYAMAIEGIDGHLADIADYVDDGDTWEEIAAAEGYPDIPLRLPGRTRFYAIADEILGPRHRSHGVTYFTIPRHPSLDSRRQPIDQPPINGTETGTAA